MDFSYWWKDGILAGFALCIYTGVLAGSLRGLAKVRTRAQRWQFFAIALFALGQTVRVVTEVRLNSVRSPGLATELFNVELAIVSVITLVLALRAKEAARGYSPQLLDSRQSTFSQLQDQEHSAGPVPVADVMAQADSSPVSLGNPLNRDRRRRLRVPLESPVTVEVLGPERQEVQGRTVDFSGDGVGLLLEASIPVDCMVLVRAEEGLMLGEVRNWKTTPEGFRVGLRIDQFMARSGELDAGSDRAEATLDRENRAFADLSKSRAANLN